MASTKEQRKAKSKRRQFEHEMTAHETVSAIWRDAQPADRR